MGGVCKKVEMGVLYVKKCKWGCFLLKKVENGGVFCKKVDLSSTQGGLCRLRYQYFYRAMLCIRGTSHGPVSV